MLAVPTDEEVIKAFEAIEAAWEQYRSLLRAAIAEDEADGTTGRQARLVKKMGRTRETLRQDAMTKEQREALRLAEAARRRAKATARKQPKSTGPAE